MDRHNHRFVRGRVNEILERVPAARESYDILYTEFIKTIDPSLIERPFYETMTNTQIPSFQSVARASRRVKQECPWLKESIENRGKREQIEESYYMEYGRR